VPALYATANPCLRLEHQEVGNYYLFYEGAPELLFCDNETNRQKLFGQPATTRYPKDSINDYVLSGNKVLVNPELRGTKSSLRYKVAVKPETPTILRFRLSNRYLETPFVNFNELFAVRKTEADDFYNGIQAKVGDPDLRRVQRQAYAGMLWNKQYYNYNVDQWLRGDPASPPPAEGRKHIRNSNWRHLHNSNVISMPDKWEYPWYAAWDLAFHCVALAKVDAAFAKRQLIILLREYYMHPNGQIPAYEWNFRRREPAGARLGRLEGVQHRQGEQRRQGRHRLPGYGVPQAAHELYRGGSTRRTAKATTSSKAASSAWTTSGCLTGATRCPPAATSNRPTAPAGWPCIRST
jgi:hypothetical protein